MVMLKIEAKKHIREEHNMQEGWVGSHRAQQTEQIATHLI